MLRFRSGPFDVRLYGQEWVGVYVTAVESPPEVTKLSAPVIEIRRARDNRLMQRCAFAAR